MMLFNEHAAAVREWQRKRHELNNFDLKLTGRFTTPDRLAERNKLQHEVEFLRSRLRHLAHLLG